MRALLEIERDEIEAVSHFIKHVLTKTDVEDFKVWEAVKELERVSHKYVVSKIITEKELDELLDLEEMKELMSKLFEIIKKRLEEME
jgi:hypothetical protein